MRVLTALAAVLLAAACQKADAPAAPAASAASPTEVAPAAAPAPAPSTTYGVVSEGEAITPAQALATLAANNGKTVRIAGTVSAVCPMRGWAKSPAPSCC